jgi:hypothetical protein
MFIEFHEEATDTLFLLFSFSLSWMFLRPYSRWLMREVYSNPYPLWGKIKHRLSLFADDVALVVRPSGREIRVALENSNLFGMLLA